MSRAKWNDEALQVSSDTAQRRKYRSLQSWYRETVLDLEPGKKGNRDVGSMLPATLGEGAVANFLTKKIASYIAERVPVVLAQGGTLDVNRLRLNMLSSMPLCFNLFGELRAHPESAARVLAGALELPIAEITGIEVEWTPAGTHPLGDRTAFDAVIFYKDPQGDSGLVGVETKYTEPFSPEPYSRESYVTLTADRTIFEEGAAAALLDPSTNQAWRNLLLTIEVARANKHVHHHMAIVALQEDAGANAAGKGLTRQLESPTAWVRRGSLEAIIDRAVREPELATWAAEFGRRYLTLPPTL